MAKSTQTQEKKVEILRAATALIKQRGLQALSFDAVAKQAGLSRQLVRYYFTDLDALILELCTFLGNEYRNILVAGILEMRQVERLKFFLDFFFDLADAHPMPDNLEAYDSLLAYAVGSADLRERLCDQYKTLGQVVVHELAIAHPELEDHACEELSFLFVSMMHAHWSFVASLGYSRDHGRLTRQAIDRLIKSYIDDSTQGPVIRAPWSRDT
ncbi:MULTISPECIES: TetR/AcrR family transcriptional regulator [unclassified Roseovarius]|uniref:TetR/AcrR family transcriptional regulator n=1 Tax=unclassified Roseovarius TaxID=2614913 RepID=UPI00273D9BF5|nr:MULTISPECIES: TetR/AcrR family transcriptional regulator [unclassified Roseovarius]